MSQLFIMRNDGHMIALAATIVDDILVTGLYYAIPTIIEQIDARFTLGIVVHGPGAMRFFVINLFQHDDMSVVVNADDKLNGVTCMTSSRLCRGDMHSPINQVERKSFA